MKNLTTRIYKIIVGSTLIGVTLISGGSQTGVTPLLALVAIPIVLSGIADWRPFEWCARKLIGFMKSTPLHTNITAL